MFLYVHSGEKKITVSFPDGLFVLFVCAHMVALAWIAGLVVRSCLHPEKDPVRRVGMQDPLGGLFAGADHIPGGIFGSADASRRHGGQGTTAGARVGVSAAGPAAPTEGASAASAGHAPSGMESGDEEPRRREPGPPTE
jgi:hypothetical protein